MLISNVTPQQWKALERAWLNFDIVVKSLPSTDITALLLFHARSLLDSFAKPPINIGYVRMVTLRVNELIKTSPVDLDIDDMLIVLNDTLDACLAQQGLELSTM